MRFALFIAASCDAFVMLLMFDLVEIMKLADLKNANTTFIVAHGIAKGTTAVGVLPRNRSI